MDIKLIVDKEDMEKIYKIIRLQENNELFVETVNSNVKNLTINSSKDDFWKTIVGCLLSTQQNSSPEGPISRFLDQNPFPLCLEKCKRNNLKSYTAKILTDFKGIRRYEIIGKQLEENLKWLENSNGWEQITQNAEELADLRKRDPLFEDIKVERKASNLISENLIGFGPKQSRNFWQWMGYTRYEIPIDSRVTRWINENGILPLKLTYKSLSDEYFYELILDWIQYLCKEANVLPCLLDAAIFSSYEK